MTQDYPKPIAPPQELVQQWTDEIYGGPGVVASSDDACLAKLAAQWGWDQREPEIQAAALRKAVNQCQNCTGAIYSPDLIFLARKLEELSE